jgi:hypothetical protein
MSAAKSFRDFKVYQLARAAAGEIFCSNQWKNLALGTTNSSVI